MVLVQGLWFRLGQVVWYSFDAGTKLWLDRLVILFKAQAGFRLSVFTGLASDA